MSDFKVTMGNLEIPLTPYAGTSGWRGSEASHDRVVEDDSTGVTTKRQNQALRDLAEAQWRGLTWKELGDLHGWHAGQSSGCLSVLHLEGLVVRLKQRRNRCSIYVLPEHTLNRPISERKRNTCKHCGGAL